MSADSFSSMSPCTTIAATAATVLESETHSWDCVRVSDIRMRDGDIPEQCSPWTAIYLHVSGPAQLDLGIDGRYQRHLLIPGNFCIVPAGEMAAASRWDGERQMMITQFSSDLLREVSESHDLGSVQLKSACALSDPQLSYLLFALREEFLGGNSSGRSYVEMLARAIVTRLLRAHADSPAARQHRGGLSKLALRKVIGYIDERLEEDLSLNGMANAVGLSADHFARAFRKSTGVPPHRFVVQRRLSRARDLLQSTAMPIADIAQRLGFADQSHLTNHFRRHLGITPGRVRS